MLFSSFEFVFVFLPVTLAGFAVLAMWQRQRGLLFWLVGASLVFYAFWSPAHLLILLPSTAANFLAGRFIGDADRTHRQRRLLLWLTIAANLIVIGYFKYATFLVENINAVAGSAFHVEAHELPLAISFFTFTQIAYLVEIFRSGSSERDPLRYAFFTQFFTHLIAGPIVLYREIVPQLTKGYPGRLFGEDFAAGLFVFAVGLFKKTMLADTLASEVDAVFRIVDAGVEPTFLEAWLGALGYTFQLYFDFSAYSDMAIGLSLMFGLRLPVNFMSPYKSTSIIDFWRHWHITLSRFLRDFLYIPLGGNRQGQTRRYANLLLTMLIGGLWHGSGWNFVLWGGMHGVFLCINRLWRHVIGEGPSRTRLGAVAGWTATFVAVVYAWVMFRAENLDSVWRIWHAMSLLSGISVPGSLEATLGAAASRVPGLLHFDGALHNGMFTFPFRTMALVAASFVICLALPNPYQLLRARPPILDPERIEGRLPWYVPTWRCNTAWGIAAGLLFGIAVPGMSGVKTFIYFQF